MDISALSSGWAIFNNSSLVDKGLIKISPKKGYGERLTIFEDALFKLFSAYEISDVVIEDIYRGPSVKVFKILSLFHGVAYKVCSQSTGKEPELISVTEVRKHLGLASEEKVKTKEQTFFIINSALSLELEFKTGNDMTDACALALGRRIKHGDTELSLQFDHKLYSQVGVKDESIQGPRPKRKSKPKRSKKSIQKAGSQIPSG